MLASLDSRAMGCTMRVTTYDCKVSRKWRLSKENDKQVFVWSGGFWCGCCDEKSELSRDKVWSRAWAGPGTNGSAVGGARLALRICADLRLRWRWRRRRWRGVGPRPEDLRRRKLNRIGRGNCVVNVGVQWEGAGGLGVVALGGEDLEPAERRLQWAVGLAAGARQPRQSRQS